GALARGEKQLAHFARVANREPAGFLAHFKRLHQVKDAHFLQASLNHTGAPRTALQFFERQTVNHFLGPPDKILEEERFDDELLHAFDHRPQLLFDIGAAGEKDKRNLLGLLAGPEAFIELAAIGSRHAKGAEEEVGRIIHDFQ